MNQNIEHPTSNIQHRTPAPHSRQRRGLRQSSGAFTLRKQVIIRAIQEQIDVLEFSHTDLVGRHRGKITNQHVLTTIERLGTAISWIKAARAPEIRRRASRSPIAAATKAQRRLAQVMAEKNNALRKIWEWCCDENATDIDADYIKRVLDLEE